MLIISYARTRLWIGISGAGLIVVACVAGISLQLAPFFLPTSESGLITDLRWLAAALIWIVTGFRVPAALPGAGVTSIAELATTCMGFTVWTLLGLLTLPTVSRQSTYAIDSELLRRGADVKRSRKQSVHWTQFKMTSDRVRLLSK